MRKLFTDSAGGDAHAFLTELTGSDHDPVLCTHGDVIAQLIGANREAKKGSVWVLETTGDGFAPSSYLAPTA